MVQPRKDIMGQAVYLAQLEAAKGKCQCNTCRIIRKASAAMTEQFLSGGSDGSDLPGGNPAKVIKEMAEITQGGEE